jgi:hypothetical protein
MSTRAYKLIEVKTAKKPTFNFNETRITLLAASYDDNFISFSKETLQEELETIDKELLAERDIDTIRELESTKKTIKQMIRECKDEDYVDYYFY